MLVTLLFSSFFFQFLVLCSPSWAKIALFLKSIPLWIWLFSVYRGTPELLKKMEIEFSELVMLIVKVDSSLSVVHVEDRTEHTVETNKKI